MFAQGGGIIKVTQEQIVVLQKSTLTKLRLKKVVSVADGGKLKVLKLKVRCDRSIHMASNIFLMKWRRSNSVRG
jgi:hypothetical protein